VSLYDVSSNFTVKLDGLVNFDYDKPLQIQFAVQILSSSGGIIANGTTSLYD